MSKPIRIVVVGDECTGKSVFVNSLAGKNEPLSGFQDEQPDLIKQTEDPKIAHPENRGFEKFSTKIKIGNQDRILQTWDIGIS